MKRRKSASSAKRAQQLAPATTQPAVAHFVSNFARFYRSEVHSDVTLVVGPDQRRIPAHRFVLAAQSKVCLDN